MDRVQNLTQAYSQAPWRKQMQLVGLFLLVLVFIALIAGVYLNVTARAATVGRDIQGMQAVIDDYEQANEDLQSQLASLTSAAEMERRASDMGFVSIDKEQPLYLVVPNYTGRQPVTLAPASGPVVAGAPMLPPEYTESLFEWLRKQVFQWSFPFLKVRP